MTDHDLFAQPDRNEHLFAAYRFGIKVHHYGTWNYEHRNTWYGYCPTADEVLRGARSGEQECCEYAQMNLVGTNAAREQSPSYRRNARERSSVLGVFGCHTSADEDL